MVSDSTDNDPSIRCGRFLSNPPPGEEIVITGASGRFPESDNVHEFRDNLFNKVDMVTGDTRRFEHFHPEIPKRTGKIKQSLSKFDLGFFGLPYVEADQADPSLRILLESTVEAIIDAGLNPSDLEGTRTGVFGSACFIEHEKYCYYLNMRERGFGVTGSLKSALANRVSYYLKLNGPSYACDTACSSSLYALEHAYRAMRAGECDSAIVFGYNLLVHPFPTIQFKRLGVLSMDGICKSFDDSGDGYARAEAVGVLVLQKAKDSKRIYAKIVHTKTNCDGYKEMGITYPSGDAQVRLLKEVYDECEFDANKLTFMEAHGTGTRVGDPEECAGIDKIFFQYKNRQEPLLLGSIKSCIGHSEPTSGICSIVKAILAFETGYIAPNLYFNTPRKEIDALVAGRLSVVTEKTPLPNNNGLIGISSFGFGGGNCHVLVKWNEKAKTNRIADSDDLPRIVCVSGRTEEAVNYLLSSVKDNKADSEHIRLIHEVFRKGIKNHIRRGYAIYSKYGDIIRKSSKPFFKRGHLYMAFGNVNKDILELSKEIFKVPVLHDSVLRTHEVLSKHGVNLRDIIQKNQFDSNLNRTVVCLAVQIALVDLFHHLEIKPKAIFGQAIGELACAYFDKTLSLKETLECGYEVGSWANEVNDVKKDGSIDFGSEKFTKRKNRLEQLLTKVISSPKKFSNNFRPNIIANAEYFSGVLTGTTKNGHNLSSNASILQVGDVAFSKTLKKGEVLTLQPEPNGLTGLLDMIGRLYEAGLNPQVHKLYPDVQFPVSRGTPMISPYIKWKHTRDMDFFSAEDDLCKQNAGVPELKYDIKTWLYDVWRDVTGHVIDGRNLFPATGYVYMVWHSLAQLMGVYDHQAKVVLENIKFKRACTLPKDENDFITLVVSIHPGTGNFEITEGDSPVVTGRVYADPDMELVKIPACDDNDEFPMESQDIYKELRLRGYHYKGLYRSILRSNAKGTSSKIRFHNINYVEFMDNMLQTKILQEDIRSLWVPTSINRISIDASKLMAYLEEHEDGVVPVVSSKECNTVRAPGIEMRGLECSSIPRKKVMTEPVLEKYLFIPNHIRLSAEESMRVNMQIALENTFNVKVKAVEVLDETSQPLAPFIKSALEDQPVIQPEISVLCSVSREVNGIKIENKKLEKEVDCMVVAGLGILSNVNTLNSALSATKANGYIISREKLNFSIDNIDQSVLRVLTVHDTDTERLVFLTKTRPFKFPTVINVSLADTEFSWLTQVQEAVKNDPEVIIYSQGEPLNGVLGLVNCIRREPGYDHVRCVFIVDDAPKFDIENQFYKNQLDKHFAINVYMNGQWGTYRHLLLSDVSEVENEHCYVNNTVRGDLSSLKWLEGPLSANEDLEVGNELVNICYSSLNFRDVMLASGRISTDSLAKDRREQECVQGFEYSGRTMDGRRVMGIVEKGALATMISADTNLMWEVPSKWSLEEATTVPVVYSTCMYALMVIGKLKKGESILIHSATGGIGMAAINLCLKLKCKVFVTVGTKEKREFLRKHYPQISDSQIGNSRDTSFEYMVKRGTKGRGVDLVLNSLAEEKLITSVRCLAQGGRFLEIGKFDITNNNALNLMLLRKNASFHGVMLDKMFKEPPHAKRELFEIMQRGIEDGSVIPLKVNVFKANEIEQAYRYMGTGKHIGKVVIQVKDEKDMIAHKNKIQKFKGAPRYYCDKDKSYIVCGGLGGFGLELADWLILRGARKVVLTSRRGVQTGYQNYRIKIWQSYGCDIVISKENTSTLEGCQRLIEQANALGPVHAIFNLAVVLQDAILENQSQDKFQTSFEPKAYSTMFLDEITTRMCPELRDFVVFSSVSCGRGNAGQTNYGMSNSVMERICERRRREGYPALAIEWGAIGDVGLVAEMQKEHTELEIGGTLQQSISNCLQVMDIFMRQNEATIVSSIVVAEKKSVGVSTSIADSVAAILGIKNMKAISFHSTLAELGMDSMSAVEIKQTLERDFDVFLSPDQIRSISLARLQELQDDKGALGGASEPKQQKQIENLITYLPKEEDYNVPIKKITEKTTVPKVFVFPGIAGVLAEMMELAEKIDAEVYGFQYCGSVQGTSFPESAQNVYRYIREKMSPGEPFFLVAHSYGAAVALEVANLLEKDNHFGTVVCIEGSPEYISAIVAGFGLGVNDEKEFDLNLFLNVLATQISAEEYAKSKEKLIKLKTFEERTHAFQELLAENDIIRSKDYCHQALTGLGFRMKSYWNYVPQYKLRSPIKLLKATTVSLKNLPVDYGLSPLSEQPLDINVVEGSHTGVLKNDDVAIYINNLLRGTNSIDH